MCMLFLLFVELFTWFCRGRQYDRQREICRQKNSARKKDQRKYECQSNNKTKKQFVWEPISILFSSRSVSCRWFSWFWSSFWFNRVSRSIWCKHNKKLWKGNSFYFHSILHSWMYQRFSLPFVLHFIWLCCNWLWAVLCFDHFLFGWRESDTTDREELWENKSSGGEKRIKRRRRRRRSAESTK